MTVFIRLRYVICFLCALQFTPRTTFVNGLALREIVFLFCLFQAIKLFLFIFQGVFGARMSFE